jgi:hypothetical protein
VSRAYSRKLHGESARESASTITLSRRFTGFLPSSIPICQDLDVSSREVPSQQMSGGGRTSRCQLQMDSDNQYQSSRQFVHPVWPKLALKLLVWLHSHQEFTADGAQTFVVNADRITLLLQHVLPRSFRRMHQYPARFLGRSVFTLLLAMRRMKV